MHLGIIDITVRKADVVGVYIECNDRSVIDYTGRIHDLNKRTIVLVADGARLKSSWRELLAHRTRRDTADRGKINCALVEYQVPVLIQIGSSCGIGHEGHFC